VRRVRVGKATKIISKRKETKMTEFGEVVIVKDVNASIEDGISHIRKVVTTLGNDDLRRLLDKLRSLRNYVHEFEYWLDVKVRNQIEIEAEQKVKAMIEAGFSFNSVTVDKVRFLVNGAGEIQKYKPCHDEHILPF
jgi:hypothetical protein